MSRFEYQFKEMIKEAVREVLLEEIEKGTLVTVEEKEEVKQPKVENIKPKDPDSIIRPKELCDMLSISLYPFLF